MNIARLPAEKPFSMESDENLYSLNNIDSLIFFFHTHNVASEKCLPLHDF